MVEAWFPLLEANQGFLSLLALVAALGVALFEHIRARAGRVEQDRGVTKFVARTLRTIQSQIPDSERKDSDPLVVWPHVRSRVIADAARAADMFDALASSGALGLSLMVNLYNAAQALRRGVVATQEAEWGAEVTEFRSNLGYGIELFEKIARSTIGKRSPRSSR